ncbi:MAG: hypothetical protein KJ047_00280 [Anaerolineae bacterium]|nr:hypothetical protein [Anaerolineae bacterium]MEB2289347.1 hypothetical protein [Anaerolineae bacterium]
MRRLLALASVLLLALWLAGAAEDARCAPGWPSVSLAGAPGLVLWMGGAEFQGTLTVTAELPDGVLGLPGEAVIWVITLTNSGTSAGSDLLVTNSLHDDLRVDKADTEYGEVAISNRAAVFSVPELRPGQTVTMRVHTTVLRGPANGVLVSQVMLAGTGSAGPFTQTAVGEVFVPTGLPATGYPPADDLPGQGEPSVLAVGAAALLVVALAAAFVWFRGRREFA